MKKILAILLSAVMCCTLLAACGSQETTAPAEEGTDAAATDSVIYAVEAGSAGEAAANEAGYTINSVASQADALMEVAAGTSGAAIIDSLMADAMIGEGTSYPNLKRGDNLTTEEYGIGCRKESDLTDYINYALSVAYEEGTMAELAETYGISADSVIEQAKLDEPTIAADGDVAYIQDKGTLVVGITDFAPMDYKDDNGEWIGFDADLAKVVADMLKVNIEFVEVDWDNKIMELDSKNVDVIWNGMTLTDEVTGAMNCTNAYCKNAQTVILPAE